MSEQKIPVIVCVGEPGRAVVFGWVDAEPVLGESVTLREARMVLYWPASCGGLFGLASRGPRDGLRLTHSVDRTGARPVSQWLAVSSEAAAALREWPRV